MPLNVRLIVLSQCIQLSINIKELFIVWPQTFYTSLMYSHSAYNAHTFDSIIFALPPCLSKSKKPLYGLKIGSMFLDLKILDFNAYWIAEKKGTNPKEYPPFASYFHA